ncbi:MAG TPA: hypothetical protein VIL69_20425 [Roseomonas sp.]|jgi:hypothetical protein
MMTTAAFWLSLLFVGYWAFWNFHRPHTPAALRYAVTLQRYWLAATVYIMVALCTFIAVLLLVQLLNNRMRFLYAGQPPIGVPLFTALLVTILLPHLPGTREVLNALRGMIQRLALFPSESRRLLVRLTAQPCPPSEASRAALRRELGCYGVAVDALERCLPAAVVTRIEEAQSLHDRMFQALAEEPRLRRFAAARADEIDRARQDHVRLLRRVARALVLAEAIMEATGRDTAPPDDDDDAPDFSNLSEFLADESVNHASSYRRLIAEAALSSFHHVGERNAFLARFGLGAGPGEDLPFGAVVGILAVAPATMAVFMLPVILAHLGLRLPMRLDYGTALALSSVFAAQQVAVVLWAVLPKVVTRFARPTLRKLPWAFYAAAALGAYLTSLATRVLLLAGNGPRLSQTGIDPISLMLVTGLFPVVTAVTLSLQIDWKLRDREYQFAHGRWRDALGLASVMALTDLLVQSILGMLGTWPLKPILTALMALQGGVIGFLVPWVVAAYLNSREREIAAAQGEFVNARLAARNEGQDGDRDHHLPLRQPALDPGNPVGLPNRAASG